MDQAPTNPLMQKSGLPRFDEIEAGHVLPAVQGLLQTATKLFDEVEALEKPTWEELFGRLDRIDQYFEQTWKPIGHFNSVKNSSELRAAYEEVLPEVVKYSIRVAQSEKLYEEYKSIRESEAWESLSSARKRIIEQRLLSAELSGVALPDELKEKFNEMTHELSKLGNKFSNNVLDATNAYELIVTDPADAEGWPNSLKNLTSQAYNKTRKEDEPESTPATGPWKITLEVPIVQPFWQHCQNRDLREQTYRAYISRASSGEFDNTENCNRILSLRREQAKMLGYKNYAEVSLSEKMAENAEAVQEMFETLRKASIEPAKDDLDDLQKLANESGETNELKQWDIAYWAERLREKKYEVTDEVLRQYFQHERVLNGLFSLVERLFDVQVREVDGDVSCWEPSVRYYMIFKDDQPVAGFYYDPYSRPENKRGGAWMDVCLNRRHTPDGLQLPVAHLVCNCTPPVGDSPSLMTFREVETLFHEFGHGLQHMLTTVDEPDVAGINGVEWDAVELPSQFMENWCYHKPTLMGMTAHVETGEPLPDELFEKIVNARHFRAGSDTLRQLTFGMTDMLLHSEFIPNGKQSIFDVQREVMQSTAIMPMLPEDRMLCSFQHIFAGGYAAGYYSYKWAEVLSADAFGAFEEAGLDNEAAIEETGRHFRDTILAQGGSQHPMILFEQFRGREPDPTVLLRQSGLLKD
ncbi:M3 family metallopeptidase [Rubinisphaera sp.]|uniref:M3 family metallopeptidase n=1 Tax=Rubinisphaera sp. TaxID=2024857 RepID=UPI000C0C6867|nr:M3 family metallopeptidase [Rubinisphaera sp.]MBV10429.1 peptidase M3 [Rubinisphaera sp.]HCS55389.1 peptidase M3 [Planctomycetaceae bacterium]